MATDAEVALGWIGVVVNIIISLVLAHGIYSVHSKRQLIHWSARHSEQLFYALEWSLLFVLGERNIQLFCGILEIFEMPFEIRWCLNNIFSLGFISIFLLRAWLIHYDFHSGVAIVAMLTGVKLSDDQKEHLDWFLANKSNYGAPKYVQRFTFSMVLIINVFLLGWSLISPDTFNYAMLVVYAIVFIISISVTRHIAILDDNFFIRKELLQEFRALAVMAIIGGIVIIFGPAMGWNYGGFILIELSVAVIFTMCFFSTYWVLQQSVEYGYDSVSGPLALELPANVPPLGQALKSVPTVSEFLHHLVNEVSVENFLFLSDVMAFKQSFVKQKKLDGLHGFSCAAPTSLSMLVYRRTFTHYAWAVAKTYVDGSSSFYVTAISDERREDCREILEDLDPSEERKYAANSRDFAKLQTVFDECAKEVYQEFERSYIRFTYTPQFDRVLL